MTGDKITEIGYPYIKKDAPASKISYSYSKYRGLNFIEDWKKSRLQFCDADFNIRSFALDNYLNNIKKSENHKGSVKIFIGWIKLFSDGKVDFQSINLLLKRFEVTRKIYGEYDLNFRPTDKADYKKCLPYLSFGEVLVLAYEATHKLQYLNALLKLNDIHCSMSQSMNELELQFFKQLIFKEIKFVENLSKEKI